MVFSNLIFLYLFLPVCLIFYFLCQNIRAKNAVLIVFSLIFYAWGEPVYLLLMIASVAVNWGFGLLIERRRKKVFLILALVVFFLVKGLNKLSEVGKKKEPAAPAAPPQPTAQEKLLMEIRDLLKNK